MAGPLESAKTRSHARPIRAAAISIVLALLATSLFALPASAKHLTYGTVQAWGGGTTTPAPLSIPGVTGVSVGEQHALAVSKDGKVYSWGSNDSGQLGRATVGGESQDPVAVPNLPAVVAVAAGASHSLAVTEDGFVYAWGANGNGQTSCTPALATSDTCPAVLDTVSFTPRRVQSLPAGSTVLSELGNITAIAAGGRHNLALDENGTIWSWGDNTLGQLGNGTLGVPSNPIATPVLRSPTSPTAIAAGDAHSLALAGGFSYGWGSNASGQIGQGVTPASPLPNPIPDTVVPDDLKAIAAGADHTLVIDGDDRVRSFGADGSGRLGDKNADGIVEIGGDGTALAIAAGGAHSLAIREDRKVVAWGANGSGQLGDDSLASTATPVITTGLTTARQIAAGGDRSVAVVAPAIELTPSIDFGSQEVAATGAPQTITVTNKGPGGLSIEGVATSDTAFAVAGDSCSSTAEPPVAVAVGASCTIRVTFTPTNTGIRAGELTFDANTIAGTHTVQLSGVGSVASGDLKVTVDESSVPPAPSSVATSEFRYQAAAPAFGVGGLPLGSLGVGGLGLGSLGVGGLPLGSLGVGGLPLGSLGVGGLPLGSLGVGGLGLGSLGVGGLPLGSLGGLPLGSLGVGGLGLGSLGVGGLPLGSLGVGPIPVTSVPLRADRVPGGWPSLLEGSRFEIRLVHDVTLGEVFASNPLPPKVAALTVGDIDWSNGSLADISPMSLVLGHFPAAVVRAEGLDWCAEFAAAGATNCEDTKEVSLLVFQLGRSELPTQVSAARLGDMNLDGHLDFDDDGTIDRVVEPAPLWTFPLSKVDLQNTDFGAVKLMDIPAVETIVDCTKVSCTSSTATLFDAEAAGAITPGATIGSLGSAVAGFTLAQATFALLPGVFLGPVPADRAGILTTDGPGLQLLHYHVLLNSSGSTISAPTVSLTLPDSLRVAPGSSAVRLGSSSTSVADPTVVFEGDHQRLTWSGLPTIPSGTTFALDVAVYPGLVTGPVAVAAASITSGSFKIELSTPAELASANTVVSDGYFEPNDNVPASCASADRNALTTGRVHYVHLSHRNDVEYLCFRAPAVGAIATVDITSSDLDVDAALLYSKDTPRDAPLRQPRTTASPLASIGDRAASLHAGETIGSDIHGLQLPAGYGVADVSTQRGPVAETVAAVSTGGNGFFIVKLNTHGGAVSRKPVSVSLSIAPLATAPAPPARVYPADPAPYSGSDEAASAGTVPSSIPADTKTLLLVNRNAVNDEYGATAASALMAKLDTLVNFLGTGNRAVVLGVDGDPGVRATLPPADADPGNVELNNAVVRKTNDLVDRLVAASGAKIENIVIVGGPTQMRYPLVRDLTIQANERSFAGQLVKGAKTNALSSFLTAGFMPVDAAYCDFRPDPSAVGWRYVGSVGCGRLVESPFEIMSVIDRYIAMGGVLDLDTSAKALAVGSDFMNDLAVKTHEINGSVFSDRSILTGEGWSDADLQSALTGVRVASINTHFDTTRALAPKSDSPMFNVSKLDALLLPQLAIVSSIGCHAGLSDSDFLSTDASKVRDWSQAFTAKGLTYAAPSTYGLGITYDIGLHELLSKHLATNVAGMKASGLTIGQALAQAQQQYMGGRLAYGVYDDKVMSMGLFGLPMWKAAGAGTAGPTPPVAVNDEDPYTGLQATTIPVHPTFTRADTADGSFYAADGGTQVVWDRPVQPSMSYSVQAGARGVLLTSLASDDVGSDSQPFNPLIARPQLSGATTPLQESQFISRFPESLATVNTTDTATGANATVVYSPGQFLNGRLVEKQVVGTQRLFTDATLQVLHAPAGDTDDVDPTASAFRGVILDGVAYFRVQAADQLASGAPGTVKRVLLQMKTNPWVPVDLAPGPGGVWTGAVAVPPGTTRIEGFGQLVDASGNVGVFGPLEAGTPAPLPDGVTHTVSGRQVTLAAPVGIDLQVSVDGAPMFDETGTFLLPDHDGLHVVDLVTSRGAVGVLHVVTDTSGPQIGLYRPTNGAHYVLGSSVLASYFCRDAATPIATCAGDRPNGTPVDTTSMGSFRFQVRAVDATGHESSSANTYTVGYKFTGFFGIADEPALNKAKAGSTIPVGWTIADGSGQPVGDPNNPWAHITAITWYRVQCPGGPPTNDSPSNDAGKSGLRYDATSGEYKFNWKTEGSWAGSCRRFLVTTDDTAVHTFTTTFS